MNIKPRRDYVLIKKLKSKKEEESNLITIKNPQKQQDVYRGKIIATGPGRRTEKGGYHEIQVNKEDKVLYKQYAGHKIENNEDDNEYWLINEKDLLAVIN